MTFRFLKISLLLPIIITLWGCIVEESDVRSGLNSSATKYLDKIVAENPGSTYEVELDKYYGKEDGRYKYARGYFINLVVDSQVVLTNNIDSLRELGFYYSSTSQESEMELELLGITIKCDTLDSIKIVTDSVIAVKSLDFEYCNIDHLSPEIGKIRTQELVLSYNRLSGLPIEILQMDSLPQPYDSLDIVKNGMWNNTTYDTLPKEIKDFLNQH